MAVWAYQIDTPLRHDENFRQVNVPGSTSRNIAAQAGVFTLIKQYPNRSQKPEEIPSFEDMTKNPNNPPLWKYTVPVSESIKILQLCEAYGVNSAILFPGYDGVGKAVDDYIHLVNEQLNR